MTYPTPAWKIVRRQFTATGGSKDPLNDSPVTSKYMKSYKYCVINYSHKKEYIPVFKTKKEACKYLSDQCDKYNQSLN